MKATIISYSFTENNEKLALGIANKISAKHVKVKLKKPMTIGKLMLDILFNRTPKLEEIDENLDANNLIIFVAPIWIGKVASPLRAYFKKYKNKLNNYVFVTISGGAKENNTKIKEELNKRLNFAPIKIIEFSIADVISPNKEITKEETSKYRLTKKDVDSLSNKTLKELKDELK